MAGSSSLVDRIHADPRWAGQDPASMDYGAALRTVMGEDAEKLRRSQARWGVADKIAMGAAMVPMTMGLSSVLSPAASAAAPVSHGYTSPGMFSTLFGGGGATAPTATAAGATAGRFSLGKLGSVLGSRGFETAGNLGLGIAGMVASNKANSQARRDALAAQTKEIELAQAQLAEQARNANLDREDARKLNDAIQALEAKKFALMQDQYAYERSVSEEDRSSRNAYRDAFQLPAARKMASILGLG